MESEGLNRNVNVAIPTVAGRRAANPLTPADPDLLPGQTDVAAPDGPNNQVNTGYLWDSALRAGLTVRNYGFFMDPTRYNTPTTPFLWRATHSQPARSRPSPRMLPWPHSPIRISAVSTTRFRIITVTGNGRESSIPITPAAVCPR